MTESSGDNAPPHDHDTTTGHARPGRLYRALAWVGIAAGTLFIVATVFFSGYVLGQHGDGGHHGPQRIMLKPFPGPDGPMGPPMGPGGPAGPEDGPRAERLTPPSPPRP